MKIKVTGKIIVNGEVECPEDIDEALEAFKKFLERNLSIADEHRIEIEFEVE